ncbi:MAG: hypothetical protein IKC26_04050 [Clostridia bacterium]|nr:hypothetical protein [Clostridia bacterium]
MKKLFGMRIFALLLCLVLAVAVFVACDSSSGGDETTTGGQQGANTETVTVSNAVIVSSASADSDTSAAVQILVDAIRQYTGVDATVKTDAELEDATKTEILVGATNRAQSAGVLADLNGQSGYVVKKVDNKIVINATNVMMIDDAVNYFVNNYVSGGSEGKFEIAKDLAYTYGSTGGVTLLGADNKMQYKIVFSSNVQAAGRDIEDEAGNIINDPDLGIDYIVPFIREIVADIAAKTGVVISTDSDLKAADDKNLEVLIGATNRPETKAFLKTLKPNEYGYCVIGNKLVIAGWGDYTSAMAIDAFIADCEQYLVDTDSSAKNLVMADGVKKVYAYDKWNVDIPMFSGGELSGVVDMLYNGYYLYYTDATEQGYKEYITQLEAAGYDFWQDNQIGGNLYATYYNSKVIIHAYYIATENSVRVAVDHASRTELPPNEDTSPNYGPKVTESLFTMHDFDNSTGAWGNLFIMTLEDGSYIIHDGGSNPGNCESNELWNLLKHMNKREDGKIVIAAWVISHGHADHTSGMNSLLADHYRELILERVIHSEAATTQNYNFYKNGHYVVNTLPTRATQTQAIVHKAHTGQIFQIRNVKMEIMFTTEDNHPFIVGQYNSTSLNTRFYFSEGDDVQTMMITGDSQDHASARMVSMYEEALKCDALQVAHHGSGGSVALYKYCAPSIVLWPHGYWKIEDHLRPGNTGYYPVINQSLLNQENVILVIVADKGHKTIKVPLLGLSTDEKKNELLVEVLPRLDGKP